MTDRVRGVEAKSRGIVRKRARLARRLRLASAWAMVGACVASVPMSAADRGTLAWSALSAVMRASLLAVPAMLFASAVVALLGRRRPGVLRIDPVSGVTVEHSPVHSTSVPLSQVSGGWIMPLDGGAAGVDLELTNGDVISAAVDSLAEARAVLEAAGVGPSRRAMRMLLGTPVMRFLMGGVTAIVGAFPAALLITTLTRTSPKPPPAWEMLWLGVWVSLWWLGASVFGGAQITVGVDGVVVRRALRPRLISHEALRMAYGSKQELELHCHDGEVLRMPWRDLPTDRRAALLERIREAKAAWEKGRGGGEEARFALLERRGRSLAEWRAGLAALVGGGGYRRAALSREDLARVLADPGASVERRVAAAVALAAAGEAEAAPRIRVAAEACASEPVRVALERAERGALDDEALARALAADAARAERES